MCGRLRKWLGVVGSDAAVVVAKDDVHNPVQGVLDGPMRSNHRADHAAGITSEVM
jgi:hypothetical protein